MSAMQLQERGNLAEGTNLLAVFLGSGSCAGNMKAQVLCWPAPGSAQVRLQVLAPLEEDLFCRAFTDKDWPWAYISHSKHVWENPARLCSVPCNSQCTQQAGSVLGSVHRISRLPRYHLHLLPQLVDLLFYDSCTAQEHYQQAHPACRYCPLQKAVLTLCYSTMHHWHALQGGAEHDAILLSFGARRHVGGAIKASLGRGYQHVGRAMMGKCDSPVVPGAYLTGWARLKVVSIRNS